MLSTHIVLACFYFLLMMSDQVRKTHTMIASCGDKLLGDAAAMGEERERSRLSNAVSLTPVSGVIH